MKLNLILIPVNSPEKGADDLRAKLGGKFRNFFDDLTVSSYAVDGKEDSKSLSLGLLRRQLPGLRNLQGAVSTLGSSADLIRPAVAGARQAGRNAAAAAERRRAAHGCALAA